MPDEMTSEVSGTWSMRSADLRSETGRRLVVSESNWAQKLVRDIDAWVAEYPGDLRRAMQARLEGTSEAHMRGALWELFWLATCRGMDGRVLIEHRDADEQTSMKSVDFMLESLGIAVEVTTVNQLDSDVRADYWRSDLHNAVEQRLLAPGFVVTMQVRSSGAEAPRTHAIGSVVQDWFFDQVRPMAEAGASRLRLDLGWQGWVIDFELRHVGGTTRTYVISSGPNSVHEADGLTREALARKAAKKAAVPSRPLLLAIADPGKLLGGGRWARLNALVGNDQMTLFPDGTRLRARADNGFLMGSSMWRNSGVSAIAFTDEALPTFGTSPIEIWLNGGAAHPIPLGPFEEIGTVVAIRDGVLMERPPGSGAEWRTVTSG